MFHTMNNFHQLNSCELVRGYQTQLAYKCYTLHLDMLLAVFNIIIIYVYLFSTQIRLTAFQMTITIV